MDQYTMMDILGKAFADGEIDALRPLMAADCDYASQYANKSFSGASEILSNMESVHKNIDETCAYTYKVIELESVLANGLTLADLDNQAGMHPCRYGLLLYQYGSDYPVAVVACMIDLYEKFRSIGNTQPLFLSILPLISLHARRNPQLSHKRQKGMHFDVHTLFVSNPCMATAIILIS